MAPTYAPNYKVFSSRSTISGLIRITGIKLLDDIGLSGGGIKPRALTAHPQIWRIRQCTDSPISRKVEMNRKGLLKDVIRAFDAFLDRRIWKRFDNFACLAVEVAGDEEPILASVMGSAGEEYGLMMLRGAEAIDLMRSIQFSDENREECIMEADMLSVSLEPFGHFPPDLKAYFHKAGIHPRFDEQVPYILIKPPNSRACLPEEEELALFLSVFKTIVAADRRNLLVPAGLDDPDGICVVTPAGPGEADVSVHRERLPRRAPVPKEIGFFLAIEDLAGLDRLDEIWLVGTPSLPATIDGDDRALRILLVVEEKSGMVLDGRPYFADSPREAVSMLKETFHGSPLSRSHKGLPRRIVFASRKLHDAAAPALRKAGVQCEYRPSIPGFQKIVDGLMDSSGGSMPGKAGFPEPEDPRDADIPAQDDLTGWKDADFRLSNRFANFLNGGDGLRTTRAANRYFDDPDFAYYLAEFEDQGVAMSYTSWGVVNYRPTKKSKTQAEKMLERGLPAAQERLLRARMESYPTIYRVAGHDPEAGTVNLEDVLLGGPVTVHDQLLSENISNSLFLTARVYAAGKFHFFETVGPLLPAGLVEEAADFLVECGMEFTPEGLRRDAYVFGWLWGLLENWQSDGEPPRLTNTDGDDLCWHTASFSVTDPEAACHVLRGRPDIEYDEAEEEFVWTRKTGEGAKMLGSPVTLGRIEFIGDELVLSANSVERFEEARAWLEKLPGIEFRSVTTRRMDEPEENRPMDERIAKPEPIEVTGEMAAALQEMIDKQSMEWLDTSVPALDGMTPRETCRTPEGRRKVAIMIRTWPDPVANAPVRVPREAMLRALGLETGPEKTMGAKPSAAVDASPDPEKSSRHLPPGRAKVGRNDPCPCGSGKKFKKCCGR
ncbi:MAG: SEC-C metal-binding domain-containing protein [Planctomycetota bacterium]